jgi:hypothetical protein
MSVKAKLAIACLLAFVALGAVTADAFVWRMSYGQAKNATKEVAREGCREDPECTDWAVGPCRRKSLSSFACEMSLFFVGVQPGEEIKCDITLHWGAEKGGYIDLKRTGRPRCFAV